MREAWEKVKDKASLTSVEEGEKVEFLCPEEWAEAYPAPVPAASVKPEWLTNLQDSPDDREPSMPGTVARCMSFMQAMNLGYIFRCPVDIGYRPVDGGYGLDFGWGPDDEAFIEPFDALSIGGDDFPIEPKILKFVHKWVIKTPPGYSCLITHPMNRPDPRFRAFSGVVATDEYPNYAHVPFVWTGDVDEKGVIERGTPIAQIIPYKRDRIIGEAVVRNQTEEEKMELEQAVRRIQAANGYYQKEVWSPHGTGRVRDER